jgi:hypothetical protein
LRPRHPTEFGVLTGVQMQDEILIQGQGFHDGLDGLDTEKVPSRPGKEQPPR